MHYKDTRAHEVKNQYDIGDGCFSNGTCANYFR